MTLQTLKFSSLALLGAVSLLSLAVAVAVAVAGGSATLNPGAATDCVRGGEQDIVTLGVNWYPNCNVRFMLNYLLADIDRRAYSNNSVANGGPNAKIGQDFNAVALRPQFNW